MRNLIVGVVLVLCWFAITARGEPAAGNLTLDRYLEQVKSGNAEARSLMSSVTSYELRADENETLVTPEFYAQYGVLDDKKQQAQPAFMGYETRAERWHTGLRSQTRFGLSGDLYFNAQRSDVSGASPNFLPTSNYMESAAVLQLNQSLWRNGFGTATRADLEAQRASIEMNLMQARFRLKNLLLTAQNAYWSLVTLTQIVKLQQENVDRAKQMRDRMGRGARLKLFDDTDAMQAQAAYESRELELQTSLDDRATMIRQFNTLRGRDADTVEEIAGQSAEEIAREAKQAPRGSMSREDFSMLRAQARVGAAQAKAAHSRLQPQLDLSASIATNGRDGMTSRSYELAQTDKYPSWSLGIVFSVPLDLGLVHNVRHGYTAARKSADELSEQVRFSEKRAWEDLLQQKKDALGRFERSLSVEKIQTELVKRERKRLINGRTTTFEALSFEQNLALAQIGRVRAQLALMQIHNALKTFEVLP